MILMYTIIMSIKSRQHYIAAFQIGYFSNDMIKNRKSIVCSVSKENNKVYEPSLAENHARANKLYENANKPVNYLENELSNVEKSVSRIFRKIDNITDQKNSKKISQKELTQLVNYMIICILRHEKALKDEETKQIIINHDNKINSEKINNYFEILERHILSFSENRDHFYKISICTIEKGEGALNVNFPFIEIKDGLYMAFSNKKFLVFKFDNKLTKIKKNKLFFYKENKYQLCTTAEKFIQNSNFNEKINWITSKEFSNEFLDLLNRTQYSNEKPVIRFNSKNKTWKFI